MEGIAITLLLMILVVGGITFFLFLQFHSIAKDNQELFREINRRVMGLEEKMDKVSSQIRKDRSSEGA